MGGVGLLARDIHPDRFRRARSTRRRLQLSLTITDAASAVTDEEAEAWAKEQGRYASALDARPDLRRALAGRLGLPPEAVEAIRFGLRPRMTAGPGSTSGR